MPIKPKIRNNKAYVADSKNDCIMIYDIPKSLTTTHTDQSGNSYYDGDGPGSLNMPAGVDVDSNGLIYVADTNHSQSYSGIYCLWRVQLLYQWIVFSSKCTRTQ